MGNFSSIFPDFQVMLGYTYRFLFTYYGWVVFVFGIMYMLWRSYLMEIQHQYVHTNKFIFFQIKVPKDNMVSTLAVETIFAQLHSLHVGKTFTEKFVEGHVQLWYSLEIISMGGKVSFIVQLPERMRHVVESAIYAHYPQAEITEVNDYMENFTYDPEDKDGPYEIFGTEWKLNDSEVIPIKTYKDFEHPAAEETIIDPLANFFEGLSKMDPHEFFAVQILISPRADDEWKPLGEAKIKELIGEEAHHEASLKNFVMAPVDKFAKFSYRETLFGGGHAHGATTENKPKNNWMNMTEGEKERVSLIEKKIGKPGYKTKIRFLYIAPTEKFDPTKKSILTGAYRPLGSVMTNKIRPDVANTWTSVDYVFSKTLEKPYLEWLLNYKKRNVFKGFKDRDTHIGLPMFILNIEELATLYHFPITTKTSTVPSNIERTESKKSQPPVNLPVLE